MEHGGFLFLFFQFCDVAKLAIMHKNILAKFGYRRDLKVENFKNLYILVILLQPVIQIWQLKFYFFFSKLGTKIFQMCQNHIFQVLKCGNSSKI